MAGPDASGASPDSVAAAPAMSDAGMSRGEASVSISHEGDVCRVAGTLDFDTAPEALEAVAPIVERGAVSRIDLGGVTRSNSAGLALMIEWLAVARRAGHALAFENVPEGLRQLAGVCQVDALISPAA